MGVPHRTKYEFSLGHKAIYNCIISYFIALMMTSLNVLEDPKNKLINPWPKRNIMALDRMMMNI